jgi:hypothetical protein
MAWYKIILTHSQIEQEGALNRLKDQFLKVFMKAVDTTDMAILSDNDYESGRISIYFSPACTPDCDVMIRFYNGMECEPPSREHVFVLAGDDDVVDSLT